MNIEAYRYSIPLVEPFVTGADKLSKRHGIILAMESDGVTALGEAAPLPGFSRETIDEVQGQLEQNAGEIKNWVDRRLELSRPVTDPLPELDDLPSLQFALDSLALDYLAGRKRRAMRKLLFKKSRGKIAVNATLSLQEPEATLRRAEAYRARGFETFKLKVGIDFQVELEIVRQLRNRYPDCHIRIDANRSWSLQEAEANLGRIAGLDIEYCEEPLKNPDPETMATLQNQVKVPIALDESLNGVVSIGEWMKHRAGRVIIIKPMVFGGFRKIFETYRLAVTHDYTTVFTTTLETGIARIMTATLASGLGSQQTAQGLATGSLLKMDVFNDRTYIDNGYFNLPDDHGVGEKYRTRIQSLAVHILDL